MAPDGPYETRELAVGHAETCLVLEPVDVRVFTRGVAFVIENGTEREVADVRWVDLAPPEARNRKFGFVHRDLSGGAGKVLRV